MQNDQHIYKIISAGQMNWFEADKVTLGEIKSKYLFDAEDYLYFRKGEDWLKVFIDWLLSLGIGPEQILELANVCGQEAIEFAQGCIDALSDLSVKECLELYVIIGSGHELARKHIQYLQKKIWGPFIEFVGRVRHKGSANFRILCKSSPENIAHLPKWKAMRTKVRFYREDTETGSHRFYLNEKGYAVFWRQGINDKTRFYGFEGTEPEVIKQLKAIFEEEWRSCG